jgi:nicotinate phosphoribosyltransferase
MADFLSTEDDDVHEGEPLIHSVMAGGRRIPSQPSLYDIRAHARHQLERLPSS